MPHRNHTYGFCDEQRDHKAPNAGTCERKNHAEHSDRHVSRTVANCKEAEIERSSQESLRYRGELSKGEDDSEATDDGNQELGLEISLPGDGDCSNEQ